MVQKIAILLCLLLLCNGVTAQQSDDYRYFKLYEDIEPTIALESEQSVADTLYIPKMANLWYRSLLDGSSVVQTSRHGVGYYQRRAFFNGIALPKISDSRLSRLALLRNDGYTPDKEKITIQQSPREQSQVGINLSTRGATYGTTAAITTQLGEKWMLCSDISLRTGRDMHIEGIFASEASTALSLLGKPDSLTDISLLLFFAPSERSTRKASVAETFALTSDNYYNPAWGYQAGKVRSANVARTLLPTLATSFSRKLTERHSIMVSLGATIGEESYSSLDYLNATTPQPDHYRKLPSYFYNQADIVAVTNAWVERDSRYTQIDFDELYRRNLLQGRTIYLLADRVTLSTDLNLCAAAKSLLTDNTSITYGIRASYLRDRAFKRASDLLGGAEFEDIDYFLVDNDAFSNLLQNDMQHPEHKVGVGDRYSYDYLLNDLAAQLFTSFEGQFGQLTVAANGEIGSQKIWREGLFQKELFSNTSYGKSQVIRFAPWQLQASAEYTFSARHALYGSASITSKAPEAENLFLQTQYNNRTITNPQPENIYWATVGYRMKSRVLALQTSLYIRHNRNQTDVTHLYNDVCSEFSDIVTTNITTLDFGAEAEAHWDFTKSWQLAAAVTAGIHRYADAPNVKVYADNNNLLLIDEDINSAEGLDTGRTPQISTFAELTYHNRGWRATLEGEFHALRYVAPSLIRRGESLLSHAATAEVRAAFTEQERLNDAFALNLTFSKSFYLRKWDKSIYSTAAAPRFIDRHPRSRITLFAAVNNLLGSTNIVYRGYESSRASKRYRWEDFTATPLPNYYLYAYPRTYYVSLIFRF